MNTLSRNEAPEDPKAREKFNNLKFARLMGSGAQSATLLKCRAVKLFDQTNAFWILKPENRRSIKALSRKIAFLSSQSSDLYKMFGRDCKVRGKLTYL